MEKEEVWKSIAGYEGLYQVSSFGRVKAVKKKERILTMYNDVYNFVYLFKKSKRKPLKIHQLVAVAFLGHIPCGMEFVIDHIDGDKTNNYVENLRITTQRENMHNYYGKDAGVILRGDTWMARINIDGRPKYLGTFKTKEEALEKRNLALKLEKEGKSSEIEVVAPKTLSIYKGVTFDKSRNKWKAVIRRKGVTYHLGRFTSEEEAYKVICIFLGEE